MIRRRVSKPINYFIVFSYNLVINQPSLKNFMLIYYNYYQYLPSSSDSVFPKLGWGRLLVYFIYLSHSHRIRWWRLPPVHFPFCWFSLWWALLRLTKPNLVLKVRFHWVRDRWFSFAHLRLSLLHCTWISFFLRIASAIIPLQPKYQALGCCWSI